MFNIVVIITILIGTAIHRYLTPFYEDKNLPYPVGFLVVANSFMLFYVIGFIWMFGFVTGIIVSALFIFSLIQSAIFWGFNVPSSIRIMKKFEYPKVNMAAYSSFLPVLLLAIILIIVNFFVSTYKSAFELIKDDVMIYCASILGIVITGNIIRILFVRKILRIKA